MKPGGPWDVKHQTQWNNKISGAKFYSQQFEFYFNAKRVTSEDIGNYFLGYFGAAMGLSLDTIQFGTAVFMLPDVEEGRDQEMIKWGHDAFLDAYGREKYAPTC
jgi:hypothetical protein